MSFVNKVKNFFYEDIEEDEDDEEVFKKENPKKEFKIRRKEEKKKEEFEETRVKDIPSNPELSERELFKSEKTFNFPMDIGDNIFDEEEEEYKEPVKEENRNKVKEEKNIYARNMGRTQTSLNKIPSYRDLPQKQEETKKFHPSPVVSPVYGVLDKNYTVDDVVDKNLSKTKEFSLEKKTVDFDSVRNKAYKELDEEIEKTLTNSKDIFYNLDDEEEKEENNDTIESYIEEPYDKNENEDDQVIITYEGESDEVDTNNDEVSDDSFDDIDFGTPDVEIPKVDEKKTKKLSKKEAKEEDKEKEDLFNLIDNMYNDEEDDEEEDE